MTDSAQEIVLKVQARLLLGDPSSHIALHPDTFLAVLNCITQIDPSLLRWDFLPDSPVMIGGRVVFLTAAVPLNTVRFFTSSEFDSWINLDKPLAFGK